MKYCACYLSYGLHVNLKTNIQCAIYCTYMYWIYILNTELFMYLNLFFVCFIMYFKSFNSVTHLSVYQCVHNMAPSYLQELLVKHTPARKFRSQRNLLEFPVLGNRFYGKHALCNGGPSLLNTGFTLLEIYQSVTLLKTFLFQEY